MDALMKKFQDSISFDIRMWSQDIRGSMAYARAINMAGIINDDEAATLQTGLQAIHDEFAAGKFEVKDGDEDIHTAVERRLKELVGDVGGKLHTGRSRNDQVATDTRFYCLEAIQVLKTNIQSVQSALVAQAEQHVSTLMPGYTHLQRGQPSTFGHWCMAYFGCCSAIWSGWPNVRRGWRCCHWGRGRWRVIHSPLTAPRWPMTSAFVRSAKTVLMG
jgi:argininosuccinate lyase